MPRSRDLVSLLDELEPIWHVHAVHESVVDAPPRVVFETLVALPANASTVMRALMTLRTIPARLMGRRSSMQGDASSLIGAMQRYGFTLIGERPGEEIVLGVAGRFWRPAPSGVPLRGCDDYVSYDEPGAARASVNFRVRPMADGRTRLSTETRVRCFGSAERNFKIYWTVIGPFSAWIRRDWLRLIKLACQSPLRKMDSVHSQDVE